MPPEGAKRIKLDTLAMQDPQRYVRYKNFRIVIPHDYTYYTSVKARWFGRSLLSVFQKEFRDRPADYYEKAIQKGWISVNNAPLSDLNRILKSNDVITHRIHRHEPAVVYKESLDFCQSDDALLTLNKPASIPVHPTGRYYYNTILEILRHEHAFSFLSNINRLDRLTSGLLLIATSKTSAKRLHQSMQGRAIHKEYIARVHGNVPFEELRVEKRIETVNFKLGLCCIVDDGGRENSPASGGELPKQAISEDEQAAGGKEAITIFRKLRSFQDGTSLVHCRPMTGRTHQIRVHLQYLGFPIVNDALYGSHIWQDFARERQKAQGGAADGPETPVPRETWVWSRDELWAIAQRFLEASSDEAEAKASIAATESEFRKAAAEWASDSVCLPSWFDTECEECQRQWLRTRREPSVPLHVPIDCPLEPPALCLHACRYYSDNWDYSTPWPEWSRGD